MKISKITDRDRQGNLNRYNNTIDAKLIPTENVYSVLFDGVDAYVDCGAMASFEKSNPFSIECWAKWTSLSSLTFVGKMESASNTRGWLFFAFDGKIWALIRTTVSNMINMGTIDDTFNDGEWRHCVMTYDGSEDWTGVTFYVDGASESASMISNNLDGTIINAVDMQIASADAIFPFDGNLDEVVVYNKELSAAEVIERYNGGQYQDLENSSVWGDAISWWRMGDGDAFATLQDNKGSNDGTMINMLAEDIVEDVP